MDEARYRHSTISLGHFQMPKEPSSCQQNGLCLDGSSDLYFNYPDPKICDYDSTCPRYYASASLVDARFSRNLVFSGGFVRHANNWKSRYQRPALKKTPDIITNVMMRCVN